jgi:hypothetical protein
MSGADECVPAQLQGGIPAMGARLAAAAGGAARAVTLEGASHACGGHEEPLVQQVLQFLGQLDASGGAHAAG